MSHIAAVNNEGKGTTLQEGEQMYDWTQCQPTAETRACGWRMKEVQKESHEVAVNSNKCVAQPSSFTLWLEPTCASGPPALIKRTAPAAFQHRPQAPLLVKRHCGRWRDKWNMKSRRNERLIPEYNTNAAGWREMKACHHEGLKRTSKMEKPSTLTRLRRFLEKTFFICKLYTIW